MNRFFCVLFRSFLPSLLSCHLIHVVFRLYFIYFILLYSFFSFFVLFSDAVVIVLTRLLCFRIFSKQNICRKTAKECWQNERIFYVYKYIDRVSTLFGPNISSSPILVRIEFCNVDAFDIWLHNHRPLHRIQTTTMKRDDFDFDYGLLYHDACSLNLNLESVTMLGFSNDVLAVEIKPKQGWDICSLPEWLLELFEISHDVRNKCRFCAMQHLKVVLCDGLLPSQILPN